MKMLFGYAFDGVNAVRSALREWGKAIDRAMDTWSDD